MPECGCEKKKETEQADKTKEWVCVQAKEEVVSVRSETEQADKNEGMIM
jgi:hypothetical protein